MEKSDLMTEKIITLDIAQLVLRNLRVMMRK